MRSEILRAGDTIGGAVIAGIDSETGPAAKKENRSVCVAIKSTPDAATTTQDAHIAALQQAPTAPASSPLSIGHLACAQPTIKFDGLAARANGATKSANVSNAPIAIRKRRLDPMRQMRDI